MFGGLHARGYILINTAKSFDELGLGDFVEGFRHERLLTVPAATSPARTPGERSANAALLGGFAALSGLVSLDAVAKAIRERFTGNIGEGNVAAARQPTPGSLTSVGS